MKVTGIVRRKLRIRENGQLQITLSVLEKADNKRDRFVRTVNRLINT